MSLAIVLVFFFFVFFFFFFFFFFFYKQLIENFVLVLQIQQSPLSAEKQHPISQLFCLWTKRPRSSTQRQEWTLLSTWCILPTTTRNPNRPLTRKQKRGPLAQPLLMRRMIKVLVHKTNNLRWEIRIFFIGNILLPSKPWEVDNNSSVASVKHPQLVGF